jgi:hypothetical protein
VLGRSYSDPQEGMSGFLLLANREVSVRAAAAETPTITTVNSKKNFMISIFGSVSGFARFTLRVRARESLAAGNLTVYRTSQLIFTLSPVNWAYNSL